MDSLNLVGAYTQYKTKQAKFTTWLKQTADRCTRVRTTRTTSSTLSACYTVRYTKLPGLAQSVASNLSPESIPRYMIESLRDVIRTRRGFSRLYSKPSRAKDEHVRASNEVHLHMINILENVLRILDEPTWGLRERGRKLPEEVPDAERLINVFETLTVEQLQAGDSDDSGEDNQELDADAVLRYRRSKRKKGKKGKRSTKVTKISNRAVRSAPVMDEESYDMEDDPEDTLFMAYCFFQGISIHQIYGELGLTSTLDFNSIRDFLKERWCDYNDGLLSLSAVSIVTDTAFNLFQRAEKELLARLPINSELKTFSEMTFRLLSSGALEHVDYQAILAKDEQYRRLGEPYPNDILDDEMDWLAMDVYWDIKEFLDMVTPLQRRHCNTATAGRLYLLREDNDLAPGYGNSSSDLRRRNSHILKKLLFELCFFFCIQDDSDQYGISLPPACDEVLRGTMEMFRTDKIPFWLVFAYQIHVDICFILKNKASVCNDEVIATGQLLRKTLTDYVT